MLRVLAFCLALLVAACEHAAQPTLVGPGRVALDDRIAVETPIAWSRLPTRAPNRHAWTVNGPLLDGLNFTFDLADGQPLFDGLEGSPPTFRAGMSAAEIAELLAASTTAAGATGFRMIASRPWRAGDGEGFRFEYRYEDKSGLEKRGTAVGVVRQGRLSMIDFRAAADHFFPSLAPAVERILETASF